MELRPVTGIRAITPVDPRKSEAEVVPAFAVESASRLEDDDYQGSKERPEPETEEDSVKQVEESGTEVAQDVVQEVIQAEADPAKKVNFFA